MCNRASEHIACITYVLSASHTYPGLYLGKKKCAWKMTLITFLKWQVDNLNLEFKKNLSRDF